MHLSHKETVFRLQHFVNCVLSRSTKDFKLWLFKATLLENSTDLNFIIRLSALFLLVECDKTFPQVIKGLKITSLYFTQYWNLNTSRKITDLLISVTIFAYFQMNSKGLALSPGSAC
jgi:hypothetical protein